MQSAYRKCHSTETALLGLHNDVLSTVDRGCGVCLVLLDLSPAFDTIDHTNWEHYDTINSLMFFV